MQKIKNDYQENLSEIYIEEVEYSSFNLFHGKSHLRLIIRHNTNAIFQGNSRMTIYPDDE